MVQPGGGQRPLPLITDSLLDPLAAAKPATLREYALSPISLYSSLDLLSLSFSARFPNRTPLLPFLRDRMCTSFPLRPSAIPIPFSVHPNLSVHARRSPSPAPDTHFHNPLGIGRRVPLRGEMDGSCRSSREGLEAAFDPGLYRGSRRPGDESLLVDGPVDRNSTAMRAHTPPPLRMPEVRPGRNAGFLRIICIPVAPVTAILPHR
ncbi:hypothetical protein DFH09DRAFT_1362388 [Mycena vulgaris]|nr:hypothetical protein DFH09DRAFT_1362388 [Mycena vulgaris]